MIRSRGNSPASRRTAWRWRLAICAAMLLLLAGLWHAGRGAAMPRPTLPTQLALLIPDELEANDERVLAWHDAAAEIGFLLRVVRASAVMRDGSELDGAALIVPDTIHRRMNDGLVAWLEQRVRTGGLLMLVHDAGVMDMAGRYHPRQSRLSALAGVGFALYGEHGREMLREQVAWLDVGAVPLLRLPPGKLMREHSDTPLTSAQPVPVQGEELAVVSYHYGRLRYPVFATRGTFGAQRLMHGDGDGVLAGVHGFGAGKVLFVNLPLTYLKLRTDGFFMHSFLRFFAQDLAQLPQLSPMPKGQGALIMNWHIDSAAAVPAMEQLDALGAFGQGPYSVHLTAGPDVDVTGDKLGMDLLNNPSMQAWVRRFAQRGDEIGSHGGWIHNEFGRLIGQQRPELSAALIERNSAAVSTFSRAPVREYSAPTGNHPAWVTPWLREHGIRSYYFTGDIGMPPTRSYQDGRRGPPDMWAFPVLSYGSYAAFEEARANGVSQSDMLAWLNDVADFCARQRTVRLVYFHPPGIVMFAEAFKGWMAHTAALVDQGALRWMTMAQYADFATSRLQVDWQLAVDIPSAPAGGAMRLTAQHPQSLATLSWLLPMTRYAQPQVTAGQASVDHDGSQWRITAGAVRQLSVRLPLQRPDLPSTR